MGLLYLFICSNMNLVYSELVVRFSCVIWKGGGVRGFNGNDHEGYGALGHGTV